MQSQVLVIDGAETRSHGPYGELICWALASTFLNGVYGSRTIEHEDCERGTPYRQIKVAAQEPDQFYVWLSNRIELTGTEVTDFRRIVQRF